MDSYLLHRTASARIPTPEGDFQLCHYIDSRDQKEHLALVMGNVQGKSGVLVRLHSECFTGDVLGSRRCDCGEQLHLAMQRIARAGQGVILYLRQEGRGIGLSHKLRAYALQDQGYDTVDANLLLGHQADEREYSAAVAMLADLDIRSVRLLTNNPAKLEFLGASGVRIEERVALPGTLNPENATYLATKVERMRHILSLPAPAGRNGEHTPGVHVGDRLAQLRLEADAYFAVTGLPFVTLTYAQTLNGVIGADGARPLAISGPESMRVTHMLRAQHDAILVGIGTVLADDPQLTTRLVEGPHPQPVILDTHKRMPRSARLWQHPKPPWIVTGSPDEDLSGRRNGANAANLLPVTTTADGRLELEAVLRALGARGVRSVMVEGGAKVIGSFLQSGLANYLILTIAPRLEEGLGAPMAEGRAYPEVANPTWLQQGADLMLWGSLHSPVAEEPSATDGSTYAHEQPHQTMVP